MARGSAVPGKEVWRSATGMTQGEEPNRRPIAPYEKPEGVIGT